MKIKGIWLTKEVFLDGKRLSPKASQKVINHSPDGFNWECGGSGLSQLALAILLKVDKNRVGFYEDFKWELIAKLPQANFEVDIDIKDWLAKKETKKCQYQNCWKSND